jgi:hypothetical protein
VLCALPEDVRRPGVRREKLHGRRDRRSVVEGQVVNDFSPRYVGRDDDGRNTRAEPGEVKRGRRACDTVRRDGARGWYVIIDTSVLIVNNHEHAAFPEVVVAPDSLIDALHESFARTHVVIGVLIVRRQERAAEVLGVVSWLDKAIMREPVSPA